jgi:hypothetical protein
MQAAIGKILGKMLEKLLTEYVVFNVAVQLLREAAKKSDTDVDDKLVETVANALGVK